MSDADEQQTRAAASTPRWLRDVVSVFAYAMVFLAAGVLAVFGAFHLPDRLSVLGAHWPLAVLVAVAGNLGLGLLAGWGMRGRGGALMVFGGWIVGVGVVMFGGTDDVVIGGAPGDWVPLGFLIAGVVAAVLAVAVSVRFVDPAARPWLASPPGGRDPRSSLRAFGRR